MYWREQDDKKDGYQVPDDVFDLVFKLRGSSLDIDHAYALSQALRQHLDRDTCARIGVHGVQLAVSGNGWNRPEQIDAELPLSRRTRLVIRVHRDDSDAVARITDKTLQIGRQAVEVGASSIRKLSSLGTIHARAVRCDPEQPEDDFLRQVASDLAAMDIDVSRMMCGKSGSIRAGDKVIFTRAVMVADLKPEESVRVQQRGIGDSRMLGCGLFVPHKGIEAVYEKQE
jgi:CRISPR-associated protein Cas6